MNQYYVWLNDAVAGPFPVEELRGKITPASQICIEGSQDWIAASSIPELTKFFPSAETAIPPLPQSSAITPRSPTTAPVVGVGSHGWSDRSSSSADAPPGDLPAKLKELWLVCRNAPDDMLAEQRKKNWSAYFKNEQEIITAEIARRPALAKSK